MSDLSMILARKKPFKHGDKTYQVSLIDQDRKADFEFWLKTQARDTLVDMKGYIPLQDWQELFNSHKDDVSTGKYGFHNALAQQALKTVAGSLKFVSILFGIDEKEMGEILLARGDEVKALMDEIAVESFSQGVSEKN